MKSKNAAGTQDPNDRHQNGANFCSSATFQPNPFSSFGRDAYLADKHTVSYKQQTRYPHYHRPSGK